MLTMVTMSQMEQPNNRKPIYNLPARVAHTTEAASNATAGNPDATGMTHVAVA